MRIPAIAIMCWMFASCASIVSYSKWPVRVTTTPPGAMVSIKNASGELIHEGITPANMELRSAQRFFKREKYEVTFDLNGYKRSVPLECKINGWYWGNVLIGGAIGMLIIDPATGAMYKFNRDYINERMTGELGMAHKELEFFTIDDLPVPARDALELMGPVDPRSDPN